jgi:hypothetical protein
LCHFAMSSNFPIIMAILLFVFAHQAKAQTLPSDGKVQEGEWEIRGLQTKMEGASLTSALENLLNTGRATTHYHQCLLGPMADLHILFRVKNDACKIEMYNFDSGRINIQRTCLIDENGNFDAAIGEAKNTGKLTPLFKIHLAGRYTRKSYVISSRLFRVVRGKTLEQASQATAKWVGPVSNCTDPKFR